MRAALAFLTPLGGARTPSPRALPWFPVVGALVGLALGGVWWGSAEVFPAGMAAALTIVAGLAITGMLHVDGLADSADGLLPHLPVERRLEVMAQPDIGAYGVAAIGAALLLQLTALSSMEPDVLLLVSLCASSRAMLAADLALGRYARSEGLAAAFQGAGRTMANIVGLLGAVAVLVAWDDAPAVCVGLLAGVGVLAFARRRIGGYTGDVLGAALVVSETVGLVLASAS